MALIRIYVNLSQQPDRFLFEFLLIENKVTPFLHHYIFVLLFVCRIWLIIIARYLCVNVCIGVGGGGGGGGSLEFQNILLVLVTKQC